MACMGVRDPSATNDAAKAHPPALLKNTVARHTIDIGGIPKIPITGANMSENRSISPVVSSIYIKVYAFIKPLHGLRMNRRAYRLR